MSALPRGGAWLALLLRLLPLLSLADGAFINFENCLPDSIVGSDPLQLQWMPLFVDAKFDTAYPNSLTVTLYGNVSGQQVVGTYPPPNDPDWTNDNITFGKIANVGSGNKFSTLFADFKDLSYSAWNAKASKFCPHLVNGSSCPLGPAFFANASNPYDLPAFQIQHDFQSPYTFSTLASTFKVVSGDANDADLACITASITPDLGPRISGLITWLPAAILIMKGIATLAAAIWSPWGSADIFRWTSNYGRDQDLLRLVTPGFGDCLQYIQFATLMGSLTLQYPGFFQPAVSKTAWSLLLFNESFVSHGNGTKGLVDGIYVTNGTYGIANMRQLIGMTASDDVWACMAVFLAAIAVIVLFLCQLGFFGRWLHRVMTKSAAEDLRQKNVPFTLGNMVRLMFNYFILPIVSLSLFQLVIADISPAVVVAMSAVLLAIVILAGAWILKVIFSTKPRTYLFDDMSTLLLYGPLYNTYSDSAAPFATIPVLITFMRGVAFGAVQPSGTAQIIILAICEVILIITLNGFRPFQNQTSMNAYHTFFSIVRLITLLLAIAFVPSLNVGESPKGWIGYAILLLHACVLVFGFFLNSLQSLIEVAARSLGIAGHDAQTGVVRGSILSWRMLKKRRDRPNDRGSTASNAAMIRTSAMDDRSDGRHRSLSASSQQLLNQANGTPSTHRLSGFDGFSNSGEETAAGAMAAGLAAKGGKADGDTYYRPPRKRTATIDALTPGAKSRSVASAADIPYQDSPGKMPLDREGNESPAPAYFRDRADSDGNTAPRTDYAVREVDQYYRGPALSAQPTRKLKTGPADPEGPTANAQSWFQRLMFGVQGKKKKEPGKGFEVVRSSRAPPGMQPEEPIGDESVELENSPPMNDEPYRDSPEMPQRGFTQATAGAERGNFIEEELLPNHSPPTYLTPRTSSEPKQPAPPPTSNRFDFGFAPAPVAHEAPTNREIRQDSATRRTSSNATSSTASMHPGMRAEMPSRQRPMEPVYEPVDVGFITRNSGETQRSYERSVSEYPGDEEDQRASTVPSLAPIESVGGLDLPSRFNTQRTAASNTTGTSSEGGQQYLYPSDPRQLRSQTGSRSGASGDESLETRETESPDYLAASRGDERPNSQFNASYHRAADSIHRNSFGANAALNATSAEIMPGSVEQGDGFARYQ